MPKKSTKPAQSRKTATKKSSPRALQTQAMVATKRKSATKAPTLKLVARIATPNKKAARPMTKTVTKTGKMKSKSAIRAKATQKTVKKTAAKRPAGAPQTPPAHGSNVIWKFLEMKEARRKEAQEAARAAHSKHHPAGHPDQQDSRSNPRHNSFAKFSGPRRRSTI